MITPVYNTLPYLGTWMASLLAQTGPPATLRIEVIAVDDGSDDGSTAELARLAALHRPLLTVVPPTGRHGPAHARNRALDLATGRYLFFLDSDDHLAPQALAGLVAAADEHGSDIVLGRVVGVNGRWVPVGACRRTDHDVPFPSPDLVWSLTPSKLFRRDLIREQRLRFREELPVYSDGPFVLEAYFRARRISVLADRDYYFLVARADTGNITYTSRPSDRLRGIAAGVAVTVRHTGPGRDRDVVNDRHLRGDLLNLFRHDFLALSRPDQESLCADAAGLLRPHLTDGIRERCDELQRLRLHCVLYGLVDELVVLARHGVEHGGRAPEALTVTGAAWADAAAAPARAANAADTATSATSAKAAKAAKAATLVLHARRPVRLPALAAVPIARAVPVPAPGAGRATDRTVSAPAARSGGLEFPSDGLGGDDAQQVQIPLAALLPGPHGRAGGGRPGGYWSLALDTEYAGRRVEFPVPADPTLAARRWWHRGRLYRATPLSGDDGELVLAIAPIRLRRVIGLRLRRVLRGAPGSRPGR